MKKLLLCALLLALLFSSPVQAASLYWDSPSTGTLTVQMSATATGTYTTVATIPASPMRFVLIPARFGFYRLCTGTACSNPVQYSADVYQDITNRLDVVEASLEALSSAPVPAPPPAPAPVSNLTTRTIDADHIEIIGGNCVSLRTTGSGLRRIVECVH